jgi:hypothetical protein
MKRLLLMFLFLTGMIFADDPFAALRWVGSQARKLEADKVALDKKLKADKDKTFIITGGIIIASLVIGYSLKKK